MADADGQNAVRLTNDPGPDLQPVWSPDGQSIVFTGTRSGVKRIMTMQVNGTDLRELVGLPGGAQDPVISPNGNTVAFTGFPVAKNSQSDIYTVSLAGGGAPLVAVGAKDRQEHTPAYLPTGELIYIADRKDKKEMNLVLRRSSAAPLVSSDAPISAIAVSPDGSRIAWATSRTMDKNRTETALLWRMLPSGTDTPVQLLPGERVASPVLLKALTLTATGGLDNLLLQNVPDPDLHAADDVRVRIQAAALNRLDLLVVAGLPGVKYSFPHVMGTDGAGTVSDVRTGERPDFVLVDRVMINPGISCGRL